MIARRIVLWAIVLGIAFAAYMVGLGLPTLLEPPDVDCTVEPGVIVDDVLIRPSRTIECHAATRPHQHPL